MKEDTIPTEMKLTKADLINLDIALSDWIGTVEHSLAEDFLIFGEIADEKYWRRRISVFKELRQKVKDIAKVTYGD